MGGNALSTSSPMAPLLEAFFVQRLMAQRKGSQHTLASYRDTFRVLLKFRPEPPQRPASELTVHARAAPSHAAIARRPDRAASLRDHRAQTGGCHARERRACPL